MSEILIRTVDGATHPLEIGFYPAGEPFIKAPSDLRVTAMLLRPRSIATFMAAMWFVDAHTARGGPLIDLHLPYLPGARQDRLLAAGDYLWTAHSITRELNARSFSRVRLLDPHSERAIAGIENSMLLRHVNDIVRALGPRYAGVIAPDTGAADRADEAATALNIPLTQAWKERDEATGRLTGFGLPHIERGHYLIVDDICDGGWTFTNLAHLIAKAGATADLYTTHGLYSKGCVELLTCFERLYCTDSILTARSERVTVLPICEEAFKV